jgi:hypothetical protein
MIRDSVELVAGVPLIVIVPGLVEAAKRAGLPADLAGGASILVATVLLALGDLALGISPEEAGWPGLVARWLIGGLVFGLAGSGLYSQRDVLRPRDGDAPPAQG